MSTTVITYLPQLFKLSEKDQFFLSLVLEEKQKDAPGTMFYQQNL